MHAYIVNTSTDNYWDNFFTITYPKCVPIIHYLWKHKYHLNDK